VGCRRWPHRGFVGELVAAEVALDLLPRQLVGAPREEDLPAFWADEPLLITPDPALDRQVTPPWYALFRIPFFVSRVEHSRPRVFP
jgi:hypothetical protein